jgi:predicted Rossmann-fold nucleotide-binding protein
MSGINLPYEPIPQQLYSPLKLFQGFKCDDSASWGQTMDFAIYQHFVMEGRDAPTNPYIGMMQALHDNAITQCTNALIEGRRIAGIMGDHMMLRDSTVYKDIAILARHLTRNGILICSGGGSGAMEASHLGASLAMGTDSDLDDALALLMVKPEVPALRNIINPKGKVNPSLVIQAHAWFEPAYKISLSISSPGQSLAFPTWHYGHEPSTPFATHIAKYFQNSIREEGLLAIAKQGVIFFEGKSGTMQEIFQNGNQNYYKMFDGFSPMILLGVDYWTHKFPVVNVLQKLFTPNEFEKYVLLTDNISAAASFIEKFKT